jgi:hypothetical protein
MTPNGSPFQRVDPIPEGMALVYVYRPYQDYAEGYNQILFVNGRPLTRLYNSGYFPVIVPPGDVDLALGGYNFMDTASSKYRAYRLQIEVKAGQTYFVKVRLFKGGLLTHPNVRGTDMTRYPPEWAWDEIQNCKLVSQTNQE